MISSSVAGELEIYHRRRPSAWTATGVATRYRWRTNTSEMCGLWTRSLADADPQNFLQIGGLTADLWQKTILRTRSEEDPVRRW